MMRAMLVLPLIDPKPTKLRREHDKGLGQPLAPFRHVRFAGTSGREQIEHRMT